MLPVDVLHTLHPLETYNRHVPLPDLRRLAALLPQQVSQCVRQMCPQPVPVFIDLVAVRLETHLFQVLDQFLAPRIHQQPDRPRGRFQLPVRQVDSLPHARIRPRCPVLHLHARVHREMIPNHVVIRRPCSLLLVPRRVSVDQSPGIVPCVPLQEFFARLPRRPVPDYDFPQYLHYPARLLYDQRTYRIDGEIQRHSQRLVPLDRQFPYVRVAVECRVHPASVHTQVRPQHFLLIELLVVAVFQPFVEIPDLFQQVPVLEWLRLNRSIPVHRIRNKLPVYTVVTPRRPNPESAQPRRPRIPQPAFQPQPRVLLRVSQLVQPEP